MRVIEKKKKLSQIFILFQYQKILMSKELLQKWPKIQIPRYYIDKTMIDLIFLNKSSSKKEKIYRQPILGMIKFLTNRLIRKNNFYNEKVIYLEKKKPNQFLFQSLYKCQSFQLFFALLSFLKYLVIFDKLPKLLVFFLEFLLPCRSYPTIFLKF